MSKIKVCRCAKAAREEADIRGGNFGDSDKDHKGANQQECLLQHSCKGTGRRELGFPGLRSFYSLNKPYDKTWNQELDRKRSLKYEFPSCTRPGKVVPLSTSPLSARAFQSLVTRLSSVPGVASSGDCSGGFFPDSTACDC